MDKPRWRRQMRNRLGTLDAGERSRAHERLYPEIEALLVGPAVMLFAAFGDEVDLDPVVDRTIAIFGWCGLPRIANDAIVVHRVEDRERDLVATGSWGIREPQSTLPEVDPATLTTVVVPGLAFDMSCGRLGRGKAFYDRFLPKLNSRARRIGVGYDCQLVDRVPMEDHDQRLDVVLTDSRTVWRS